MAMVPSRSTLAAGAAWTGAVLAATAGLGLASAAAVTRLDAALGLPGALALVALAWLALAGALALAARRQSHHDERRETRAADGRMSVLLTAAAAGLALGRGKPDEAARLINDLAG